MSSFRNIFRTPSRPNRPVPIPVSAPNVLPTRIASGVNPIGMSYWNNINYHQGSTSLRVVLSIQDELVIFLIDKTTLNIINEYPLGIHHTGEGVYFSKISPHILYVPMPYELLRVNIITGSKTVIWHIDAPLSLWQCHSSHDDRVHSASIKDSNYNIVRWGIKNEQGVQFFDVRNTPDECQIDKSGKFLLIKEGNYNRIIDLTDGTDELITDEAGALGHSDCGFGIMTGENDQDGTLTLWHFESLTRRTISNVNQWNLGYVSHCHAPGDFYVVSGGNDGNIYRVESNGLVRLICHSMNEGNTYEDRPKANTCPLGEFAIWTARVSGVMNAYIVRIT